VVGQLLLLKISTKRLSNGNGELFSMIRSRFVLKMDTWISRRVRAQLCLRRHHFEGASVCRLACASIQSTMLQWRLAKAVSRIAEQRRGRHVEGSGANTEMHGRSTPAEQRLSTKSEMSCTRVGNSCRGVVPN
jgi:hypothetical protein